jgi:hypothetical protein
MIHPLKVKAPLFNPALELFRDSKKSTLKTYQSILSKLTAQFGERDVNSLTPEEILSFLTDFN